MGQYASPYMAMGNNPVSFIDPSGGYDMDYATLAERNNAVIEMYSDQHKYESSWLQGLGDPKEEWRMSHGGDLSGFNNMLAENGVSRVGWDKAKMWRGMLGYKQYSMSARTEGGDRFRNVNFVNLGDARSNIYNAMAFGGGDGGNPDGEKEDNKNKQNRKSNQSNSRTEKNINDAGFVLSFATGFVSWTSVTDLPKLSSFVGKIGNTFSVPYLGYNGIKLINNKNSKYGDWLKWSTGITSTILTSTNNPYTVGFGLILGVTDAAGGLDWMYNNANRTQKAGFGINATVPGFTPFIWIPENKK